MLTNTIKELKNFLDENKVKYMPISQEEIDKTVAHFVHLPTILIEFYQLIGEIDIDDLGSLNEEYNEECIKIDMSQILSKEPVEKEFLDIAFEIFGMFKIAIKYSDLGKDNPDIYFGGEIAYAVAEALDDAPDEKKELIEKGNYFESEDEIYIKGTYKEMFKLYDFYIPTGMKPEKTCGNLLSTLNYFIQYWHYLE